MLQFDHETICREAIGAALANFSQLDDGNEYPPLPSGEQWKREFPKHFEDILVQSLQAPQDAVRIAQQGLQFLHSTVQYGNTALDFCLAPDAAKEIESVAVVQGSKQTAQGENLVETISLANKFVESKRADSTLIATLEMVVPTWCNLQNRTFVVLNGLADMAPTRELLKRGATVYLIAHPSNNSNELVEFAQKHTSGKLIFPSAASNNLLENLNDIVHWLERELKQHASATTICNVQHLTLEWALVCDALIEYICNALPDTIVSHVLTSNNNVHLVNNHNTNARMVQERQTGGGKAPMGSAVRNEKHLGRLDSNQRTYFVENSITGSDIAVLAQLVAQWRIILARQVGTFRWLTDKRKHRVSVIVAVPKATPAEVASLREITILLLIRDLRDPMASPTVQLDNSYQLYLNAAIH